jgi:hypothetical protein
VVGVLLLPSVAAATVWPSERSYSRGVVYYDPASWNACKARIECKVPSISTSDRDQWGWLSERVKVNRNGDSNHYVEVGYRAYKWIDQFVNKVYLEYTWQDLGGAWNTNTRYVTNFSVYANNFYDFQLRVSQSGNGDWWAWGKQSTSSTWTQLRMYDGSYYCPYGHLTTNQFAVGMISNCSSARIATASDNINISQMQKASDGGTNFSFGPDGGYGNNEPNAGEPRARGDWDTPAQTSHNRRYDN